MKKASPDFLLNTLSSSQWKKIGLIPHHGVNTPLFSLHSLNSSGIGEFLDLKLLIDWLQPLGFDVIQLLPLYASGIDPSPYNALSANALNSIYITLDALPGMEAHADLKKELQELKVFNQTKSIQYLKVKTAKEKILRTYVEREKAQFLNLPDYCHFIENNPWIEAYAQFKALKLRYQWKNSDTWPKTCDLANLDTLPHKIIQYIAYNQMESVKHYAATRQMFLMGDIPILISPDSADVWEKPQLFDRTKSAGAPPDYYNLEGQNWGFPLYNYKELEKEQFHYWKQRLECASRLFHIYRIDHIVGFFRIWAIPSGNTAKEGHFIPEDKEEWGAQGSKMLKFMLENAPMLPIGEDLGVIPKDTRAVMHSMGISGTKVIYWERNWEGDQSFIPFANYPHDSLTTVSTHDSEPLCLWWKAHPEDAKAFAEFQGWTFEKDLKKEHLFEILRLSHHTSSLFHINLLQEYLALFPELTWGTPNEERINLPGTISPSNWTYRYKCSIEEMQAHSGLNQSLKDILK